MQSMKQKQRSPAELQILEAHELRKMKLRLNGTSLAELARALGVSKTTMSWVSLRKLNVPRAEQAIAEAMGMSVEEAFPSTNQREDRT